MIDKIRAGHGSGQRFEIEKIGAMQTKTGIFQGAREELNATGGKVVESDDLLPEGQKPVREVAADEAGGAGDKSDQWLDLLWIADAVRSNPRTPTWPFRPFCSVRNARRYPSVLKCFFNSSARPK